MRIGILAVLVCWPLAMFGGMRPSTALPWGFACLSSLLLVRPRFRGRLDLALLILTGCLALQLVPLPAGVIGWLAPRSLPLRDSLGTLPQHLPPLRPLSVRAPDSEWALLVLLGAIALFWTARTIFSTGGVRRTVRVLSLAGLALTLLALVRPVTGGHFAVWRAYDAPGGLEPFGPFANGNHFAAWTIMAIPLCVGYLASRSAGRRHPLIVGSARGRREAPAAVGDPLGLRVGLAAVAMVIGLGVSRSASGALALGLSALVTLALLRFDLAAVARTILGASIAAAALFVAGWSRILALPLEALPAGAALRIAIWREAIPLARDFWLVGTGAGTYGAAMFLYRHAELGAVFSQARNQYLQTLVEGGLLLAVPVAFAMVQFALTATRSMRTDRTPIRWVRAGAACGLGAVAIQCLWESSLASPANAGLAAVLAAILVHKPEPARMRNGKW